MRTGLFFETSQSIVKSFLSNVIAIDDKLFFGNAISNKEEVASAANKDPFAFGEEESGSSEGDSGLGVANISLASSTIRDRLGKEVHNLDYQDLSLAFAEYGINCSGFIPDVHRFKTIEDAAENITLSAKRVDATILDWRMDENFGAEIGSLAKASILKILQHDKSQHGRLRLIVIYTAEPNIAEITGNIAQTLQSVDFSVLTNKNNINFDNADLEFCQITVIEKKTTAKELREEVVSLFTELTIGLLPNATLSTLSELRDKTHHILHTFSRDLDPAYLSHVIGLLSSPKVRENAEEVALDYAAELIAEELKSMIQISHPLKLSLEKNRIIDWLSHINMENDDDFFEIVVGDESGKVGSSRMKELIEATENEQIDAILQSEPKIISKGQDSLSFFERNRIQVNLKNGTIDSHEKLSIIECKRRDGLSLTNLAYAPNIKLGSIIKDKKGKYYICLQPLCDSVRLSSDASFLFLAVKEVKEPTGKFTHVIQSKTGENIRLMARCSTQCIRKFDLKRNKTTRTVKASNQAGSNEYIIQCKKESGGIEELFWVGELKNNVAQAISNQVAASISRIGLDTNEWLRLSSSISIV
ncbi:MULTISPECIES: response regulator receiver domain [Enterobacteriaceae]|nr:MULTISPECIES: response regulator receiver domain [Klebsiella]MCD9775013.1 response regulator receiver domain [Klebsiella variicola subsp. variicola]MCF1928201.1 response regulator receiver domain [Klebsiella pneumoniae]MCJ7294903.1 response regulator receiver domain [Klebsiella pneumoniae]MCP5919310.1 response regulator receiver domain [Klebsiella pneumoniae]MCP6294043.1 response regulator receiver domain [Klebsiella pneumoniae]